MTILAQNLNYLLSLGTILLQIVSVILIILLLSSKEGAIKRFLGIHGLFIAFLLSASAITLSLFYSEVLGFEPCSLCWYQRIFLYPQVILLAIALIKKERAMITNYIIGLSLFGAFIALYQHYLQMGGSPLVQCQTLSEGVDCAKRIVFEFGYITFPLMSFTIFVTFIVLMLFVRRYNSNNKLPTDF